MNALLSLLANLEADGLTGRVNVGGHPGGWVYIQEGLVYCAERADEPRMLVAMAEEGLFSAEEWQMALRLPSAHKWRALVGDDDGRLNELVQLIESRGMKIGRIGKPEDTEALGLANFMLTASRA